MSLASARAVCEGWAEGSERRIVVLHGQSGRGKTKLVSDATRRLTARTGIPPRVWSAAALTEYHIDAICREELQGLPARCVTGGGALVVEHFEDLVGRSNTFDMIVRTVSQLHRAGHPVMLTVTRMPPASTQVLRWMRRLRAGGASVIMVPVP